MTPAEPKATVLVVDDDAAVRTVISGLLKQDQIAVRVADSGDTALATLEQVPIDAVLTDLRMPRMDGMELLHRVTTTWPDIPVVMITAHGTVENAVEAMKSGAADFVLKPFDREGLLYTVHKALARRGPQTTAPPPPPQLHDDFIWRSPVMQPVVERIERAAAGASTVLIRGESGTGKEVVARAVHLSSARKDAPFVKVLCAALPDTLLESELFGYEKGAFTGATTQKPGRVELADQGTLFLDEIGDLSAAVQVKLLRLLQDKEVERLGSTQTQTVDARFIAATHQDLEALVEAGKFREDLFYRLNVVPIVVPPLRERPEDIPPLVEHFAGQVSAANELGPVHFDAAAMEVLGQADWPGNVRQLQNLVERLVVLTGSTHIGADDVRAELSETAPSAAPADATLAEEVRKAEKAALRRALDKAKGNRSLAARLLGISRRTLYNKLDEYDLS